jgi:hypothetical protein
MSSAATLTLAAADGYEFGFVTPDDAAAVTAACECIAQTFSVSVIDPCVAAAVEVTV